MIAFGRTGGEKGDVPHLPILLGLGPDTEPRAAFGDKGYASRPHYRGRARIEQAVGRFERFKRVALRCEKTQRYFASIVALTAGFILVKSVHTA
jgi:hypothetical protein